MAHTSGDKVKLSEGTYLGFANLPNQVHRKSVKKGFEFTLMVVGESGLGKSTLIDSLFLTDLYPERLILGAAERLNRTVAIEATTVDIEERGVKLRLTVVDTPGYGDSLDSSSCFESILSYIDAQYERYLRDESGLNRRHLVDYRVHCCFYFVSPHGHGLKLLDVEFLKALSCKVNVVPVIAKADSLTMKERERLKKRVMKEMEDHGIKIYQLPDAESDEEEAFREQLRLVKESVPFAVVGSTCLCEVRGGRKVRGRLYPWGVVEHAHAGPAGSDARATVRVVPLRVPPSRLRLRPRLRPRLRLLRRLPRRARPRAAPRPTVGSFWRRCHLEGKRG
uniref:Septin-7 n=1 Tax=Petromyzon marinus TaxID=7757 RepID=A0AAJ7WL47_PETMA|nr:septin-2-like isoform X2 [Petromyzon marinus]